MQLEWVLNVEPVTLREFEGLRCSRTIISYLYPTNLFHASSESIYESIFTPLAVCLLRPLMGSGIHHHLSPSSPSAYVATPTMPPPEYQCPSFDRVAANFLYGLSVLQAPQFCPSDLISSFTVAFICDSGSISRSLCGVSYPSNFIYPSTSHVLLRHTEVDVTDVPYYMTCCKAIRMSGRKSADGSSFLSNGMKSTEDWKVLKRQRTW